MWNHLGRLGLFFLLMENAIPVLAADMPSREGMWKILQQQQREVQTLKERLGEKPPPGDHSLGAECRVPADRYRTEMV